jgi:AcrR family transcriptional regulator
MIAQPNEHGRWAAWSEPSEKIKSDLSLLFVAAMFRSVSSKHEIPTPKQARAVITRAKIVGAAIECLTDHGYAGSSTTRIAKRAGVSQGSLFKHFPAKPLLLATATQEVFVELRASFVEQVLARVEPGREMAVGVEVLWEIYTDPRLHGVFEMYLATRTDAALRHALEPVVDEHFAAIQSLAGRLFPASAGTPQFEHLVGSLMLTLQGAAMMVGLAPGGVDAREPLEFLAQFAAATLGAPDVSGLRED